MLEPGVTMICILGIAYLMNYSSMTYSIGLILTSVGKTIFPAISVLLGVLGCILTGSVAGSNALFGNLTVVVAQQLGLNPSFIAASLCSGGTLGKTLTPQNLIIAGAAIGEKNSGVEKKLIYRVSVTTAFFIILLTALVLIQYGQSFS
ncbi:MAG: L-lactate permease [Chloroflexi bacterium ADurb.Bin344]|nr:MAG: L-lactate permease [Chloroflexi bacterium ADurb.Bin344]